MFDLATLGTCAELTAAHAAQAASSAAEIRVLLQRFVAIARPGEGCPKIVMALARLVGQEWIEGQLRVEISGDDASTTLTIMCELGAGIRERILPITRFAVPLDEFSRALELSPTLVLPLRITDEKDKMVLTPLLTPEQRGELPPQVFELDDKSLGEDLRKTAPPPVDDDAEPRESGPVASAPADSAPSRPQLSVHEVPTRPNHLLVTDED